MPSLLSSRIRSLPVVGQIVAVLLVGFLCAVGHAASHGAAPSRKHASAPVASSAIADRLLPILTSPALSQSHVGVRITTLDGRVLFAWHDLERFTPASNTKLLTTAAASALLPVDTLTWTTRLVTDGTVDSGGTLHGNLILLGSGDPTMSSRNYPYRSHRDAAQHPLAPRDPLADFSSLCDQLAARGIRAIDGNVIGDDTLFTWEPYGVGWGWDDIVWSYGAPVSALTLDDNVVRLHVAAGANGSTTAAWTPPTPFYTLENSARAATGAASRLSTGPDTGPDTGLNTGLDRMPGSRLVRLWGAIPPDGYTAPIAIEDPAEFAAQSLRMLLTQRGIPVSGTATARHRLSMDTTDYAVEQAQPLALHRVALETFAAPVDGRQVLATHQSPPVVEDIVVTNKVSQNLHAELLLRLLGRTLGSDGSYAQGVRVVRQFLLQAGVPPEDFFFHDGSGMSMSDVITPRAYTTLLAYAAHQPWGAQWRRSLPVGGEDGTLVARFGDTALNGRIEAKTGSLSEVSTLSGYMTAASGKTLVFSILVNGHLPDNAHEHATIEAIDKICLAAAAAE